MRFFSREKYQIGLGGVFLNIFLVAYLFVFVLFRGMHGPKRSPGDIDLYEHMLNSLNFCFTLCAKGILGLCVFNFDISSNLIIKIFIVKL